MEEGRDEVNRIVGYHFSKELTEGGLVLLWEQHKVHKSKDYFSDCVSC